LWTFVFAIKLSSDFFLQVSFENIDKLFSNSCFFPLILLDREPFFRPNRKSWYKNNVFILESNRKCTKRSIVLQLMMLFNKHKLLCIGKDYFVLEGLGILCLKPLSTIFQLYRGTQFDGWRNPEYPLKTTCLSQIIDKLYWVPLAMIGIKTRNISGGMHWLHAI
jgi:hypothetical protein